MLGVILLHGTCKPYTHQLLCLSMLSPSRNNFRCVMEVELLWRRPNAPSVALRAGLRLIRLAELWDITEQLLVSHQSGSQWTHSYHADSAQLARRKPRLHAIGGPSNRQPMSSLVSSCLGSAQTPKVINMMYKNRIGEN